jgi:hypothetical protein
LFKYFKAPPCKPEVYQKEQTGRLLLPPSLKWSPFRHVIYRTYTDINGRGKETEYSAGQADSDYMQTQLNRLVEEGQIAYNGQEM